ncbi:NHL repeat-containing protein [Cellulophaga baltica]|uniref:NHL repeat-containing protein n=1 Tax=Cellulophaga baltica TaxID=76594 RepID=A0A1G7LYN2_9FLAO|nr:NHL repeat-containing protein [Cellulophaga baltica]SDF54020.1 NHL repeat-containing protein [Cellulophaga baltica]
MKIWKLCILLLSIIFICGCSKDSSSGNEEDGTTTFTQEVTTLAGSGAVGRTDGTSATASFYNSLGVAVDAAGNVYVADTGNDIIRKITAAGIVTTLAGSETEGSEDGTGTAASFNSPNGIAVDATGNVYVADTGNHKIRKITTSGAVTTFAGSGTRSGTDANGIAASFNRPVGLAVDVTGNIYVADSFNQKIRKITPAGAVTTLAGSGSTGSTDAMALESTFSHPRGIAVDADGNVYVADTNNYKIRKIAITGEVTTLAGSGSFGRADGTATTATFQYPSDLAVDADGNVYVADHYNHLIRKITTTGIVTTWAGATTSGSTDATGTEASFYYPHGITIDTAGNIYVADSNNNKIRKITNTPIK